jgi:hypothetical protein
MVALEKYDAAKDQRMTPEIFDIETGMDVHAADGQKIGRVAEIAGFGATRIPRIPDQGTGELVIQAKTGSGYFNVDGWNVQGREAARLVVPFRGIHDIAPGRGVTLTATIIEEPRQQRELHSTDASIPKPMVPATIRRRWWPKWL